MDKTLLYIAFLVILGHFFAQLGPLICAAAATHLRSCGHMVCAFVATFLCICGHLLVNRVATPFALYGPHEVHACSNPS